MFIGEFIKKENTTRETVRFYIDEELLTPEKINGKFNFTAKEQDDFQNIRELKHMGLSIRVIKQIKKNKENCGTKMQWTDNLGIIEEELERVTQELMELEQRKLALIKVKHKLEEMV